MSSSSDEQVPLSPGDLNGSKVEQCTNETGEQTAGPILDPLFNFELVVFKVETTLFRVPKLAFLNAAEPENPFLGLFSLTPPDPNNVEGASLHNPIVLKNESSKDFRAFLHALYPLFAHVRTFDENTGVLRLATKWNFDTIRKKAIQDLSMTMARRGAALNIHMGNEFKVPSWLISGLVEVVLTKNLDINQLCSAPYHLDWETIAKIFYIQDLMANQQTSCPKCRMSGVNCRCRATDHVNDIFNDEIAAAKHPNEAREGWARYDPEPSRKKSSKK